MEISLLCRGGAGEGSKGGLEGSCDCLQSAKVCSRGCNACVVKLHQNCLRLVLHFFTFAPKLTGGGRLFDNGRRKKLVSLPGSTQYCLLGMIMGQHAVLHLL